MTEIDEAQFPRQLDEVRAIFREYAASLEIDLSFQDFEAELAALPGKYAAPRGRVLLALNDGAIIGCVALRPLDDDGVCEMKRLYVRPAGRGQQLGRRLATQVVQIANAAGYTKIRLDTLPSMRAAQDLYVSLGFRPIPAYVFNPVQGTQFLELDLSAFGHPRP
ncbi:MAG: GNAT family N-acetyltransferase [Paraburkholderia sp.]|uniref:GNAT family N-acetyltransferase n=1 Tax=Paraburkholderia sp. TaxID=1926495 RepID=UPI003C3B0D89